MTTRALPSALPRKLHIANLATSDYDPSAHEATADLDQANVVSSSGLLFDQHFPVLDLDVPAHLVPSSTPGHSHLYLDVSMTGEQLWWLCDVLVEVGVLERGYVDACRTRGYTSVRLPWIRKPDVKAAS